MAKTYNRFTENDPWGRVLVWFTRDGKRYREVKGGPVSAYAPKAKEVSEYAYRRARERVTLSEDAPK